MRPGALRGYLPVAVAAGLLVLVWAAAAGPFGVLSDSGRRYVFSRTPAPSASATPEDPGNLRETTAGQHQTVDLSWVGELLLWVLILAVLAGVFLGVRALWRVRWHPPEKPPEVEFDVLPEAAVAEALREDAASQLAAVAEGSPRNGIVLCWLRLEEVIAGAGLPPSPWETSAEFTVRVLHALDIDPHSIGELSALYREARFSEHDLDENARIRARSALQQLHSDLQELGVAR